MHEPGRYIIHTTKNKAKKTLTGISTTKIGYEYVVPPAFLEEAAPSVKKKLANMC